MIEIELINPENFLKIKETLTRCGIANNRDKTLYQSCHILQKKGRYYIVHFKELLKLDGRSVIMTEEDELRRNNIAKLLTQWKLCELVNPDIKTTEINNFRVLRFDQKSEWKLIEKYSIGR